MTELNTTVDTELDNTGVEIETTEEPTVSQEPDKKASYHDKVKAKYQEKDETILNYRLKYLSKELSTDTTSLKEFVSKYSGLDDEDLISLYRWKNGTTSDTTSQQEVKKENTSLIGDPGVFTDNTPDISKMSSTEYLARAKGEIKKM